MADIIDELVGLDDAALAKKLGFEDKVKQFKLDLARAAKLKDKGRAQIAARLTRMFTPDTYLVGDMSYELDRAEKKDQGKTTPSEIASCCCDVD